MPLECEIKNELAKPTRDLIDKLWEVHKDGGGSIPSGFFYNLLSAVGKIPADLQEQLDERGDIEIEKSETNSGRFENKGPRRIKADFGKIDIKIPKVVSGDYLSLENEFKFVFDSDAAIKGCKWTICMEIERFVGSRNQLSIDVSRDSLDRCFTFNV